MAYYHKGKLFHAISVGSLDVRGYHDGDDPDAGAVYIPKTKLKVREEKNFNPNDSFLIEHTMLHWIPIAFTRNEEWRDLAEKTTSHDRDILDEIKIQRAETFLRNNPEFITYCRLAIQQWGTVSLQWAAEAYRWPFDAFDLPLREIKAAQVQRAKYVFEQKKESSTL